MSGENDAVKYGNRELDALERGDRRTGSPDDLKTGIVGRNALSRSGDAGNHPSGNPKPDGLMRDSRSPTEDIESGTGPRVSRVDSDNKENFESIVI